ncbi:hypothetical protein HN371_27605 [Candidatus Poribacteria bacterium]|nr:hypothetical protein [Candidatus Poribacteria bacterium]MBT7807949.1 hypothetical protein [Candidatus Poribacteria bacterium]
MGHIGAGLRLKYLAELADGDLSTFVMEMSLADDRLGADDLDGALHGPAHHLIANFPPPKRFDDLAPLDDDSGRGDLSDDERHVRVGLTHVEESEPVDGAGDELGEEEPPTNRLAENGRAREVEHLTAAVTVPFTDDGLAVAPYL